MPLTFPAHQAPLIPLKLRYPKLIDATALCIGAATPDLAYPFGHWIGNNSHNLIGITVWAIPAAIVAAVVLRARAARGVFAHLPDAGPLRLRSYRVLTERRPSIAITLASATLGALSHIVLDAFTHQERLGSQLLGLDTLVELPEGRLVTIATLLQNLGHTVGSLIGVAFLYVVARFAHLERWYGATEVRAARAVRVRLWHRLAFWAVVAAVPTAMVVAMPNPANSHLFTVLTGIFIGLLVAGCLPLYREDTPSTLPDTAEATVSRSMSPST